MFKIQSQAQPWAAGAVLTFPASYFLQNLNGVPLHVAELVITVRASCTGDVAGDQPGWELSKVVERVEIVPNKTCGTSLLSGHAMQHLDWLLTGRRGFEPAAILAADVGVQRTISLRLPFHGGLLGGTSREFSDLVSPMLLWQSGLIRVTCSDATPFLTIPAATIVSATITVTLVCEPYPVEWIVGPSVVYGETISPAGPAFDYPSHGLTGLVGLAPADRDTSVYPAFYMEDRHLLSGDVTFILATAWNATVSHGAGNSISNDAPECIPLLWCRPSPPQTSLAGVPVGVKRIDSPANTASEHRLIWAQLRELGDTYLEEVSRETGRPVPSAVTLPPDVEATEGIKMMAVARTLPRRVPRFRIEQQPGSSG